VLNEAACHEDILGSEVMANAFSTSTLDGHITWSAPCCKRITPGKSNSADYWTGGWVDLRNSLDVVEKKNLSASVRYHYPIFLTNFLVPGLWN
jgi:hypothetical protein